MTGWSPERGWGSLLARAVLFVAGIAILVLGLTTTIAVEPIEGPSTQNVRTVRLEQEERQRLVALIEEREVADVRAQDDDSDDSADASDESDEEPRGEDAGDGDG